MTLTPEDLKAIEQLLDNKLKPIIADISEMKKDLKLLATINQLDLIRKDARLRGLYEPAA